MRKRSRYRKKRPGLLRPIAPIRNVTLSRALVALVVTPCLVYAWVTVRTARDMRMENVLERNVTTARLAARLLNAQCNTGLSVLRFMSARYDITGSLREQDYPTIRNDINRMVDAVPDLAFAAVYSRDGRLFVESAEGRAKTRDASARPWFREVMRGKDRFVSDVVQVPDGSHGDAIALAIPLGSGRNPRGVLLAYYKLGPVKDWFRQVSGKDDVQVKITNLQGRVIGPLTGMGNAKPLAKNDPVLALVREGAKHQDGMLAVAPAGEAELWTGYAVASIPNWIIMISQPAKSGLMASNFIVLRFALLYLPVIIVMWIAVRALAGIYHQQEEMSRQLAEQNKRLMASDKTKSEFLANVSHDLWTPLAGLQLSITGLLDPKISWTQEQINESLQLASDEVDQLTARVRNLLEMARLESDSQATIKEPCDLADIVGSALERLRPLLRDRRVDAIFPTGPLMMECRHAQFEMVVMNLLENAIKYSPPRSPLVIRGEMRGEDIYFSLRDYGPGVDPEEAEKIFDKFYRGKPSRHLGGSGLGLAICKTVVEAHGGIIGVMNAPGGGAEFWFSVPALEPVRNYRPWTIHAAP